MPNGFLALLAATMSAQVAPAMEGQNAFLSVGATVIRPVEISSPLVGAERTIYLQNIAGIELRAVGATVRQSDQTVTIVADEGSRVVTVELIY